jgi:hypothetical protein
MLARQRQSSARSSSRADDRVGMKAASDRASLVALAKSNARNSEDRYVGGQGLFPLFSLPRGFSMRGRKPQPVTLAPGDLPRLQQLARQVSRPFFQVQRARIVLAVAGGQSVQGIAARWECDPATVWRLCRHYEQDGLDALLAAPQRSGRPERISPPPAGPDHSTGLPGAGGQGTAYHALV